MLWLWGMAGAFVYAANALILALWNDGATTRGRVRAGLEFSVALATGAIFAEALTGVVRGVLAPWFGSDPVAVALTIGWSCNYLWPRVLRKLGQRVDALPEKAE